MKKKLDKIFKYGGISRALENMRKDNLHGVFHPWRQALSLRGIVVLSTCFYSGLELPKWHEVWEKSCVLRVCNMVPDRLPEVLLCI